MKRIAVGYDDSEPARRALARAAEIAKALEHELVVISVVPVAIGVARGGALDPIDTAERHKAELEQAKSLLAPSGVTAEYVEAVGEPGETIVELAREHDAEMIVVGSRHLGLVQRLFGQSVSDAVEHRAHCDVLIVR